MTRISIVFTGVGDDPRARDGKRHESVDVVPRVGEIVILSGRDYEVRSVVHEPSGREPLEVQLRRLSS